MLASQLLPGAPSAAYGSRLTLARGEVSGEWAVSSRGFAVSWAQAKVDGDGGAKLPVLQKNRALLVVVSDGSGQHKMVCSNQIS